MAGFKSFFQMLGFTGGEDDEMKNDDRYENDEEEDEDDEEEETDQGGFGFPFSFSFFSRKNRPDDSDEDEEEEQDDEQESEEEGSSRAHRQQQTRGGRVIDYNKKTREKKTEDDAAAQRHCEHIVVVRQLGDSRSIITHLHNGDSVILNLENIDPKDCGRVIDLLSGAAFALGGSIIKVSRLTYLLAPNSVKVVPPQNVTASNRFTM